MQYNSQVVDYWTSRFEQKRAEAALTRVDTLLGHPYVNHIVGQSVTTIDFPRVIQEKLVVLIRLSDSLSSEIRTFIGTIIISELVHAVKKRPTKILTSFVFLWMNFRTLPVTRTFPL